MTVSKRAELCVSAFLVDHEVVDALDEGCRESGEPEADGCGECKKSREGEVEWKCTTSVHWFGHWSQLSGSVIGHVSFEQRLV
jgi:hypothetical protein